MESILSMSLFGHLLESGTAHNCIPIGGPSFDKELERACWQTSLWLGTCIIFPGPSIETQLWA